MLRLASLRNVAVLTALILFGASGCTVHAQTRARGTVYTEPAVVVVEEPPPPRVVHVQPRAGYVYIQGRWDRRGNNWHWQDGHWERQRANAYYRPGRWQRHRNRGHVYVEGRWEVRKGRR
jgi:WXXGXW repeat (2 copies)